MSSVCEGLTRKNQPCKSRTKNESGFCNKHIDQWYEKKEIEIIERKRPLPRRNDEIKSIMVVSTTKHSPIERLKEKVRKEKEEAKKYKAEMELRKKQEIEEKREKERKLKEIMEDININKKSWHLLFMKMINDCRINKNKIDELLTQYRDLVINNDQLVKAKVNTQNVIQRSPDNFLDLLEVISLYEKHIEKMETDKKILYTTIDKLESSNNNIRLFSGYYTRRFKRENSDRININAYRKKTTDDFECVICMCESHEGIILDCGHKFHIDCIANWFCSKLTCPTCRVELKG
jgi:hypothetical protein